LLGAISGGALAPVGVAVGAKVGGFVGAVGGGWLYDKVVDKPVASVINKVSSWFGW
jgi:phage tail tape-measure protein